MSNEYLPHSLENSKMSYFNNFLMSYINLKATFPPILNSAYEIEQHYYAKNFRNNFEMIKKIIYDMATEKDYQVQFEITVRKKKKNHMISFTPCKNPHVLVLNNLKKAAKDTEIKKMHRHKNCPKLFGKTFFNLVLNNVSFQKKFVLKEELNKKAEIGIFYPKDQNPDLSINDFYEWIKKCNYHQKYTNLKTFREIWEYKSPLGVECDEKWRENHFKFFLTKLMKIFFEEYAYNYIINSNIMNENGEQYLNLIPKFIRGIEEPSSFLCLLE